jgi:PAS domain S-box-containing protein
VALKIPKKKLGQTIMALSTKLTVRRQGYIVIAIPMLCLIGSLGAFGWLKHTIDRAQMWVDRTDKTLFESNSLIVGLLNAETGARGYALTQNSEFLEPYYKAQNALPRSLEKLNQLVSDNPPQQQRVEKIKQQSQERLTTLAALISQVSRSESKPFQVNRLNQLILQGKVEMDSLRSSLVQFEREEQSLLKEHQNVLTQQRDRADLALWVAAGISALGSIIALTLFSQLERNLRHREKKLVESKTLLQAVVSNVVDGVVILDQKGDIEAFNVAAEKMFGYEPFEVIGQNISLLLADPLTKDCDDDDNKTIADLLKVGQRWETLGCHKGKESFPIELSVSQFDLANNPMIVIIRDITERQQAEAKLQDRAQELSQLNFSLSALNTLLQQRNRELDQFAYVASHDLKAPLRAISNLSEWLEEDLSGKLSAENQAQMHLLRTRVYRMNSLIDGLLEYSRVGRLSIQPEIVNVQALLEDIIEMLSPPPSFRIEMGTQMPTLMTRRIPLRQVFSNLIENAIEHNSLQAGTINISVEEQDAWYEFVIKDDGQGIDPQYHEKIFVIFQTLQARDIHESTGVGLSIVKKIIETEGGTIRVDSHLGSGATFRFTWPKSSLW